VVLTCDDDSMTEEPEAPIDDAQFRAAKFGALPPRIHPDEQITTADTNRPQEKIGGYGTEDERMLRTAAG
jgi:hypothetical protein